MLRRRLKCRHERRNDFRRHKRRLRPKNCGDSEWMWRRLKRCDFSLNDIWTFGVVDHNLLLFKYSLISTLKP